MKVAVLRTFSNSCEPIYEPLRGLGHEVRPIVYDLMNIHHHGDRERYRSALQAAGSEIVSDFGSLPTYINGINPDFVLMIGCCDAGGAIMPDIGVLSAIGEHRPFIHLCCDGSETDWWPQLERYQKYGKFALQINIDGVKTGPISAFGLTTLCPVDATGFSNPSKFWNERSINLGFCGSFNAEVPIGWEHPRSPIIRDLVRMGLMDVRQRDDRQSPDGYRAYMSDCKCAWNHAATGSGNKMHVKARVLETAYAGALLFEQSGSPTSKWFDPGFDYLEYETAQDIERWLDWVNSHFEYAWATARLLQQKVMERHSPKIFWDKVFARINRLEVA